MRSTTTGSKYCKYACAPPPPSSLLGSSRLTQAEAAHILDRPLRRRVRGDAAEAVPELFPAAVGVAHHILVSKHVEGGQGGGTADGVAAIGAAHAAQPPVGRLLRAELGTRRDGAQGVPGRGERRRETARDGKRRREDETARPEIERVECSTRAQCNKTARTFARVNPTQPNTAPPYPEAMPLAMIRTSGSTPECSTANSSPVRPNPLCTSSARRSTPWSVHHRRSSRMNGSGAGT